MTGFDSENDTSDLVRILHIPEAGVRPLQINQIMLNKSQHRPIPHRPSPPTS